MIACGAQVTTAHTSLTTLRGSCDLCKTPLTNCCTYGFSSSVRGGTGTMSLRGMDTLCCSRTRLVHRRQRRSNCCSVTYPLDTVTSWHSSSTVITLHQQVSGAYDPGYHRCCIPGHMPRISAGILGPVPRILIYNFDDLLRC